MGKEKVRIAFIGVGWMGQCAHLANYAVIPECEVVALAELREDVGEKVARRYGVERVYSDHREMLDKEDYDAVVCVQQFTRHGVVLPEVLSAGKPVFIEKPLADSVEVGARILEAEKKSGRTSNPAITMCSAFFMGRFLSLPEVHSFTVHARGPI